MKRNNVLCATLGALLLLASAFAAADEQLARLTIDVSVEGAKSWKNGADYSNARISEKYHLVTHLQSSGEPDSINVKDPQFAQQQMAMAAQVQQKVREAQARAGKSVPKAAATQEEYIAQQQQLAGEMQKGQVACAGDVNCLMQLAQEYAQQAALLSYPPMEGAAPVTSVEVDEEAPEEARYLSYYGYEGCPGEIHIVIDNTSEGATADVSGMVPFKQADSADYRGTDLNLKMQCLASTLVYDLKQKQLFTDGIGHPAPRGSYRYWDRLHGETLNEDTDVTTTAVAWEWVADTLRKADASGSASTTLPLTKENAGSAPAGTGGDGATVTGDIKVSMTWTFQPL